MSVINVVEIRVDVVMFAIMLVHPLPLTDSTNASVSSVTLKNPDPITEIDVSWPRRMIFGVSDVTFIILNEPALKYVPGFVNRQHRK